MTLRCDRKILMWAVELKQVIKNGGLRTVIPNLGSTALNWGSTGRNIYLEVHGRPLVRIQINNLYTINSRYIEAEYNKIPAYSEM